jgi:hypothetical protein
MGTEIKKEEFDERDYELFAARLEECLETLRRLLDRPGFGAGAVTIGTELELFLVDAAARPLARNDAVLADVASRQVTHELNRFNLELNSSPVPLAGEPFTALGAGCSTRSPPRQPGTAAGSRSSASCRRWETITCIPG